MPQTPQQARRAPPRPKPLPRAASDKQRADYESRELAWWVGERLRAVVVSYHTRITSLPDDLFLPMTARYADIIISGTRRVNDGMSALIDFLDRQSEEVEPMARAYKRLKEELPRAARAIWARHIWLWNVHEVAALIDLSDRQTCRLLHAANARLRAYALSLDPELTRIERRGLYRYADTSEAAFHRDSDADEPPPADDNPDLAKIGCSP